MNQTSVASVIAVPFQSAYNALKAAMAMFSACLRLELQPFDITVVDLKTGTVKSNFAEDKIASTVSLPEGSIYEKAKEVAENFMRGGEYKDDGMPTEQWARLVAQDLLKQRPTPIIWSGGHARMSWFSTILPFGWLDGMVKKIIKFDVVEKLVRT